MELKKVQEILTTEIDGVKINLTVNVETGQVNASLAEPIFVNMAIVQGEVQAYEGENQLPDFKAKLIDAMKQAKLESEAANG